MIDYFKLVEGDALPLSPQPDPQPDTGEDLDACPAVGNCPDARPRVREFSRPSLAPRSDADDEGRGVNVKEDDMNRLEKVLYTARVHTTGGRAGASRSSDGRLEVRLSRPGSPGTGTNPEQLLAAGWSACFESAMEFAARNMKITLPADHAVDAEIDLGPEGGAFQPRGSPLREPAGDGARDGAASYRGDPPSVSLFASNARKHRRRNDAGLRPPLR